MKFQLDIDELRRRESERIEWKENVADIEDVIKTIVAFSNDFSNLGGGYVICGAVETKDESGFQKVELIGLDANRFKEIEGKVLSDCQNKIDPAIVPIIEEIETTDPGKRILVFIIPATEHAHSYRPSGKNSPAYYVRIGRTTREARNAILRELLVKKKALEPWDRRKNSAAVISDIDLVVMREYLQNIGVWDPVKGIEKYLSATEPISAFVPPLLAIESITSRLCPRNFTLLLFCSQPTKFFPGAYTILSAYPGHDRSTATAERTEIVGTIVEQTKQIIARLNLESFTAFDKTSPHPNQLKYPQSALQEAVVNALVHRDYESDQPTRISIFSDRIEINSPGSLPRAVDREKFLQGQASPYWRNQAMAYFFNRLQLAQAEGQGIPTIIRTMRAEGCPDPVFAIGTENLICILPAHPRHKLFAQIRDIENDIVIGNHGDALLKIESILKDDPNNFRIIELYSEVVNIIKRPDRFVNFIKAKRIDFDNFAPSTLIIIAETLLLAGDDDSRVLAENLLNRAALGQLEEIEIKKVAIGIRKIGNDEKAIQFLTGAMEWLPSLRENSALLEIMAKSKIELAKRCMDTAREKDTSNRLKFRAWEQCRSFLDDALNDLNKALQNSSNPIEKEFIENDIAFLNKLMLIAKKPEKPHRSRNY